MIRVLFLLFYTFLIIETSTAQKDTKNVKRDYWITNINISFLGEVSCYTKLQKDNQSYLLRSIKNRDKILLGNKDAALLRIFKRRKFNNSFLTFQFNSDSGKIYSIFGNFSLKNIAMNDSIIHGDIFKNGIEEKVGQFLSRQTIIENSTLSQLNNYKVIFDSVQNVTDKKIYNPKLLETDKWKMFLNKMKTKIQKVNDDVEFMILFYGYAKKVGFSHYLITKQNVDLNAVEQSPQIQTKLINDSLVLLKFLTLSGRISEIDSVFFKYEKFTKILDFRGTPGGNFLQTYKVASYLIDDTINAGAFLNRKYFEGNSNPNVLSQLPFLLPTELNSFYEKLNENKGIKLLLYPNTNKHNSFEKVYFLIDRLTASACEPLVYGLKKRKNVEVIGENTRGAVLSASIFSLGNKYFLILPTADYLTSEGTSLEGAGVSPTIKVKPDDALNFILRKTENNTQ